MNRNIFIVIFLLIGLTACTSRKASELKRIITQKKDSTITILLRKGGPEEEKLACLIKEDFKGALQAIDKQEKEFNDIIGEIAALPVDGIPQGPALKAAATDYYTYLRDLQLFDRKEIAVREVTHGTNDEKIQKAQDDLMELDKEKIAMNKKMSEKIAALNEALEKFSAANHL